MTCPLCGKRETKKRSRKTRNGRIVVWKNTEREERFFNHRGPSAAKPQPNPKRDLSERARLLPSRKCLHGVATFDTARQEPRLPGRPSEKSHFGSHPARFGGYGAEGRGFLHRLSAMAAGRSRNMTHQPLESHRHQAEALEAKHIAEFALQFFPIAREARFGLLLFLLYRRQHP